MIGPYKAIWTGNSEPSQSHPNMFGVEGPGPGLGFYAWLGYPQNTLPTMEAAEQAARLMNLAFKEGESARGRAIADMLR